MFSSVVNLSCNFASLFKLNVKRSTNELLIKEEEQAETHVVDLQFALVLFLQVSWQVVEHGSAAAPVGVETRGAGHLVHLQPRLLVCGGGENGAETQLKLNITGFEPRVVSSSNASSSRPGASDRWELEVEHACNVFHTIKISSDIMCLSENTHVTTRQLCVHTLDCFSGWYSVFL